MKKSIIILVLMLHGIAGMNFTGWCQNPDSVIVAALAAVHPDSMMNNVQALQDMGTRFMIAPNRKQVANWLVDKFYMLGLTEVRLDSFQCYSHINYPPIVYDTTTWQYNVEAKITGSIFPEEEIVMIGHYDCAVQDVDPMLFAPGADDNASGTSALLECARVIMEQGYQPAKTIVFLASAAEELMYFGDAGTEHYAAEAQAEGRNIVMAINNDMIAWNDGTWTLDLFNHTLSPLITSMAIFIIENYTTLNVYSWQPVSNVGGDIQPFLDAGYQGIYFMEHYINPNYHSITDLVENCDFQFLAEATKVSLGMILYDDIFTGSRESLIADEDLNIWPNPVENYIEFNLEVVNDQSTYKILNANGIMLHSGNLNPGNRHSLNIGPLSTGIYFLTINTRGKSYHAKIIRK